MPTKFYTPTQAAKLIINARTNQPGISRARCTEFCRQGRIGQRVGNGWIISDEEIEKFNRQIRASHRPSNS